MIKNIRTKDLKLVQLIVADGSLTAAANRMHVSQPAASQRLSQLQKRIGTDLFQRIDGRMQPTAAGRRLAEAAESVARVLDTADSDLRDIIVGRSRHLRVTTQCFTCYRWLPFVIGEMHAIHDGLGVDVVPDATDDPYQALADDRVDIAVMNHRQAGSPFREIKLFDDELYAVMHIDHALAGRRFITAKNLSTESLVLYTGKKHAIVEEVMRPAGVMPDKVMQVRITEAIIELARAGQGIAILSGWSFDDLDNKDGLVAVRITRGGFRRTWCAVVRDGCDERYVSSFVRSVQSVGKAMRHRTWRRDLQARSRVPSSGVRRKTSVAR